VYRRRRRFHYPRVYGIRYMVYGIYRDITVDHFTFN
jgi:hypothetical protein